MPAPIPIATPLSKSCSGGLPRPGINRVQPAKYWASWQSRQATRSPCSTPSPAARAGCAVDLGAPFGFDGTLIHNIAHDNWSAEGLDALGRVYPPPPSRETQVAEAILKSVVETVRSASES